MAAEEEKDLALGPGWYRGPTEAGVAATAADFLLLGSGGGKVDAAALPGSLSPP